MSHIIMILKGAAIGVATLVPGVSGGTMAILLGVYDFMIHGISNIFKEWRQSLLPFIELGMGAIVGMGLLSSIITSLLKQYEIPMQFLFIGIILGGLPTLYKKTKQFKQQQNDWVFFLIGLVLVFLTAFSPSAIMSTSQSFSLTHVLLLFISGIILAIALVLPGISASFLLLILGMYEPTLQAIQEVNFMFLIPVGLGTIFGTLASAKIIEYFLDKYPSKTYLLIIGFVVGSLFELFPSQNAFTFQIIMPAFILAIVGFISTFSLGKLVKE